MTTLNHIVLNYANIGVLEVNNTSGAPISVPQPSSSTYIYGAAAGVKLYMETPPATCPVGTTSVIPTLYWDMNASGGANSATMTMLMSNYAMKKLQ